MFPMLKPTTTEASGVTVLEAAQKLKERAIESGDTAQEKCADMLLSMAIPESELTQ